jgi:hypothetical protein
MKRHPGPAARPRAYTKAALVAELRRVAAVVKGHYSQSEFRRASSVSIVTVLAHFGSWATALKAAGLRRRSLPRAVGGKYTWQQCLANLDRLHRTLGRAPRRFETDAPPSRIGSMAYIARFGAFSAALAAYAAHRAGDTKAWPLPADGAGRQQGAYAHGQRLKAKRWRLPPRVDAALRNRVLARDKYKCVACGASPATDGRVKLHVDHKRPRALGGTASLANLQTLCAGCNLRKAAHEAVWFPPQSPSPRRRAALRTPFSPCASGPGGGRARRSGCP